MTASQNELYERIKEPIPSPSLFSKEKQLELSKLEIWLEKYDKSGDTTARHHRMLNEIYAKREEYKKLLAEKFVTPYLPPHNIEHFKKEWIKSLDEDEVQGWIKYPLLAMKSFQDDYKIKKAQEKDKDLWESLGYKISHCKMIFDSEILPKHTDKEIIDTYFFASEEFFKELRAEIEKYADIVPLAEFGKNYAEFYHDSTRAVKKLLAEKQGQVAGAFFRDDLGHITLTWGDSKQGLAHIIERRTQDNIDKLKLDEKEAQQKALDFVKNELSEIITQGKATLNETKNRILLTTDDSRAIVALDYKGKYDKWVLTGYKLDSPNLADLHKGKARGADFSCSTRAESSKKLGIAQTGGAGDITSETLAKPLPQNQHNNRKGGEQDSLGLAYSHQNLACDPKLQLDSLGVESNTDSTTQLAQSQTKPKLRRMR